MTSSVKSFLMFHWHLKGNHESYGFQSGLIRVLKFVWLLHAGTGHALNEFRDLKETDRFTSPSPFTNPLTSRRTCFLHFSLFSAALSLWDLANSRPVYSLMLSSQLFFCLSCLLPLVFPPLLLSVLSSSSCLPTSSSLCLVFFLFHRALQDGFGQTWWTGDMQCCLLNGFKLPEDSSRSRAHLPAYYHTRKLCFPSPNKYSRQQSRLFVRTLYRQIFSVFVSPLELGT